MAKNKTSISAEHINTDYLYEDNNLKIYSKLIIDNELGGYRPNSRVLQRKFPINGKEGYVIILDPLMTVFTGEKAIRDRLIPNYNIGSDFNKYINPNYKTNPENCRDIFDELLDDKEINFNQDVKVKILFPLNFSGGHWILGEVIIDKTKDVYNIEIFSHNPSLGSEEESRNERIMQNPEYGIISEQLKLRILGFDNKAKINFDRKETPYKARQYYKRYNPMPLSDEVLKRLSHEERENLINENIRRENEFDAKNPRDVSSCGVIVVEDLLLRIENKSLDRDEPYPRGALELRTKHSNKVIEYTEENSSERELFFFEFFKKSPDCLNQENNNSEQNITKEPQIINKDKKSEPPTTKNSKKKISSNPKAHRSISFQTMFSFAAFAITAASIGFFGAHFIVAPYVMQYIAPYVVPYISAWSASLIVESTAATICGNVAGKIVDHIVKKPSTKHQDRLDAEKNADDKQKGR